MPQENIGQGGGECDGDLEGAVVALTGAGVGGARQVQGQGNVQGGSLGILGDGQGAGAGGRAPVDAAQLVARPVLTDAVEIVARPTRQSGSGAAPALGGGPDKPGVLDGKDGGVDGQLDGHGQALGEGLESERVVREDLRGSDGEDAAPTGLNSAAGLDLLAGPEAENERGRAADELDSGGERVTHLEVELGQAAGIAEPVAERDGLARRGGEGQGALAGESAKHEPAHEVGGGGDEPQDGCHEVQAGDAEQHGDDGDE